jgi:urease accessory protein
MSFTISLHRVQFSSDPAALLRLLQFADSALPIGAAAHSFGLESLVSAGLLRLEGIETFLTDYLEEAGVLEAAYCGASCALARDGFDETSAAQWFSWNTELGARKLARESRDGSMAMGRRFLDLAARVSEIPLLLEARRRATSRGHEIHLAPCFGLAAGAMGIDSELCACAYLQQSVTALVSCCQRLLPLGQTRAHQILWDLKPTLTDVAKRGCSTAPAGASCFTPLLDVASARHASLPTRLFIS